jgi:glycosyltransferase involved in cell wall biosynthesis
MSSMIPVSPPPVLERERLSDAGPLATLVDVAVIVPAFNEVDGIDQTVTRLRSALTSSPYSFEIVVVDDGSTDGTAERARATGVRVLRLPENRGYGAALKHGIEQSNSRFVAIIDADGTYPAEVMPGLVAGAADADMVVGARSAQDASIPKERWVGKWILGRLASYLAGRRIPDLNSGMRVMRRATLNHYLTILPSGFSFTTTITLAMLCNQHTVVYVPIVCVPRIGTSKIRAADFMAFVMLVLRTVVLFNPLRIFLPLGGLLFFIGLVKFVYDVFLWNLSETAVMAFLAAIVVWSVGLLADMIARLQLRPPSPF